MKVFKNLFGKGDKIHVNEIAYKDLQDIVRLLGWGVIVESGSNSDGNYIKYGDGTMICWGTVIISGSGWSTLSSDTNKAWSGSKEFQYPQPFVGNVSVVASPDDEFIGDRSAFVSRCYHSSENTFKISLSGWGTASGDISVNFISIGPWK